MSPPEPYIPIDELPDFEGTGNGPLEFQENGDVLLWWQTWRNDYEIAGFSNDTPIVVTTSTDNAYVTGQLVTIKGSAGSVIDGTWTITVVNSSRFSLDTSTAGGVGVAGGRVYDPKLGLFSKLVDACAYFAKRFFGGSYVNGLPSIQGRKILNRPRVVLPDANALIDTSQGDVFEVTAYPAAARTIRLRMTSSPAPLPGETIQIVVGGALPFNAGASDYIIKREDSALVIANFIGAAAGDVAPVAQFEFAIPTSNIATASNTTPIKITTQEVHVFVTGEGVTIAGCTDAGANGTFAITRVSSTEFTLDGTTADGGGTGGTATGEQGTWRLGMNSGGGSAGGVQAGVGA